MTHESSRWRERSLAASLGLAAVLVVGSASATDTAGRMTALIGDATVDDQTIQERENVLEGASIATGDEGNLAMLVDDDALVELCAKTEMRLLRDEESGKRIIEVGAGTTRIIVDPNTDLGSLQIVTPAMVATIMGTAIYVTVDPDTKESTVVSEDHVVRLESSDPNVKGSTVIQGNQKLTMRPGEAPPATPEDVDESELEKISECLKDMHGSALAADRSGSKPEDRLALADGQFPPWYPPPPDPSSDPPGDDPTDPPIEPPILPEPEMDLGLPEGCGEVIGDFCFPF